MSELTILGAKGYGKKTATAGTALVQTVDPMRNARTVLTFLSYTAGNTAHTITAMRPLGSTTLASATAANTNTITLTADPGAWGSSKSVAANAIAANDYVVLERADGTFHTSTVAAGTFAGSNLTLTTSLPTGVGASTGAKVWFYGITTDSNPADGLAHPQYGTTANTTVTIGNTVGEGLAGFVQTAGKYEPIVIHSNNATADGTIERLTAVYTSKGGPNTSNA